MQNKIVRIRNLLISNSNSIGALGASARNFEKSRLNFDIDTDREKAFYFDWIIQEDSTENLSNEQKFGTGFLNEPFFCGMTSYNLMNNLNRASCYI